MAQRSINIKRVMMDTRTAVAPSDVVEASMAGLARVFASVYTLEMGWWKMAEATSGACTQGAISRVDKGTDD